MIEILMQLRTFLLLGRVLCLLEKKVWYALHIKKSTSEHKWIIEEIDGGHLGVCDFWACENCEAGGGPVNKFGNGEYKLPLLWKPFLPGTGLDLSQDCDEAKQQIEIWNSKEPQRRLQTFKNALEDLEKKKQEYTAFNEKYNELRDKLLDAIDKLK